MSQCDNPYTEGPCPTCDAETSEHTTRCPHCPQCAWCGRAETDCVATPCVIRDNHPPTERHTP